MGKIDNDLLRFILWMIAFDLLSDNGSQLWLGVYFSWLQKHEKVIHKQYLPPRNSSTHFEFKTRVRLKMLRILITKILPTWTIRYYKRNQDFQWYYWHTRDEAGWSWSQGYEYRYGDKNGEWHLKKLIKKMTLWLQIFKRIFKFNIKWSRKM